VSFDSIDVGLLPRESYAGSGIDTELDHLKAVIQEKLSESCGCFSLIFGAHWQIKRYH
jgi:hypothetical protein